MYESPPAPINWFHHGTSGSSVVPPTTVEVAGKDGLDRVVEGDEDGCRVGAPLDQPVLLLSFQGSHIVTGAQAPQPAGTWRSGPPTPGRPGPTGRPSPGPCPWTPTGHLVPVGHMVGGGLGGRLIRGDRCGGDIHGRHAARRRGRSTEVADWGGAYQSASCSERRPFRPNSWLSGTPRVSVGPPPPEPAGRRPRFSESVPAPTA